ncbi:LolA family protein [Rudaeicoccus suwonensis]|uniref:Outer membrane lipoprotein-sorting protein n=1 Tax=Rudaeicoccus suwonensis TaxID=657409 RepID=A0A561E1E5_9MICO|nr:hypothetical protein [Rudaeicoccus suwonensis]TWE09433.1 hypothetical protein BKA23_3136 [Rudaeicoccus suwonensis]
MSLFDRRPALRWVAPGAALAVVVVGTQIATRLPADAAVTLPHITAAQLLTQVESAKPQALQGTVSVSMNLGLPSLPTSMTGGSDSAQPLSWLSGTHTAKVWYDGAAGSRVALLGDGSETDIYAISTGVWVWNSADRSVEHIAPPVVTGNHRQHPLKSNSTGTTADSQALTTPEGVASWALQQLDATTAVTTSSNVSVAGRSAYQLVLTPKTSGTKIGSVRVAFDAATKVPLRAEVYAAGASSPAVSVGFSSVSFTKPAAGNFDFTPPPGAKVTVQQMPAKPSANSLSSLGLTAPTVTGTGWASVATGTLPMTNPNVTEGDSGQGSPQRTSNSATSMTQLLKLLPTVSGSWGTGHLLSTSLFTAVLANDGRYAIGAVPAQTLYTALAKH